MSSVDPAEPGAQPAGAGAQAALQTAADGVIAGLTEGLGTEDAALALAVLAHRAVIRLHTLGRAAASERKGQADWPLWAQLQNASRGLVLQAATCRTLAARLAGK